MTYPTTLGHSHSPHRVRPDLLEGGRMAVGRWGALAAVVLAVVVRPPLAAAQDTGVPVNVLRLWQMDNNLGWRALLAGDLTRAEAAFRRAIEAVRPYETGDPRLLARSYCDLARVMYEQKRYAQAEPLAKWALSVREKHPRVSGFAIMQSLAVLAVIERGLKHFDEAEQLFRRSLAYQEKLFGPVHHEVSWTVDALAGVLRDQGKYPESEKLYKRALEILKRLYPDDHPEMAETSEHYAQLLRKLDRLSEAELLEARARTIRADAEANAKDQAEAEIRARAQRPRPATDPRRSTPR